MNKIILLSFLAISVLFFTSCSKAKVYSEENMSADPNYLEETQMAAPPSEQTITELQQLQEVNKTDYKIGIGDKFRISVYDEPELDTDVAIVKQDGTISFRLVGEVHVEGLTITQATSLLETKLKQYLTYPKISMLPYEIQNPTVVILGKVANPQVYPIEGHMRVLDAIAKAGGLATGYFQENSVEFADLEKSYIMRDGKILPVDFVELLKNGNMLHNIPLQDKDYIYFPSSGNREIYILGYINSPGHYFYKDNMTLMQAIATAQGFKELSRSTVYVIRGNLNHPRMFKVNTSAIMHAKMRDFLLKPNDIIFIP
ncbi:MAG TPA: polysaccharide biosynthesis/export family protein, partial [Candidatus Cloacimonadota bacterium]|nr:polysaccharide biosynthesis/export family protein [Candidatus Cloacimonadota bacterium]